MGYEAITNLALAQAAEDERKRREEQAALQQQAADLKRQEAASRADEASGPAALLKELTAGKRAAVAGDVLKNAEEDQFLNDQTHERFQRREADFGQRAEKLAVPGPTAAERAISMSAPLGRFGAEDPSFAAQDLKLNPRERQSDAEALLAKLTAPDVSRETSTYTNAPRATPREDTGTMPYTGALDGLLGADVPRAGIRKEFGGTAPDTTLSFSDRPEAGMRRYNSSGGTTKDVGAPGGGLIQGRGPQDTTALDAQRSSLQEIATQARRAPLTEREQAGRLVHDEPAWDAKAAELADPSAIETALNQSVADGATDPKIGAHLKAKYIGTAHAVLKATGGEWDSDMFREFLQIGRSPAPGEAEARARTGGQAIPQAQAAEQAATQDAREPPPGGPGTTQSPALANDQPDARDALLSQLRQPHGQSMTVPGVGGEVGYEMNAPFIPPTMGKGPAVPPWMADLPEDIRLVLEGATQAAGGRESRAERQRRLAREAQRRGQ